MNFVLKLYTVFEPVQIVPHGLGKAPGGPELQLEGLDVVLRGTHFFLELDAPARSAGDEGPSLRVPEGSSHLRPGCSEGGQPSCGVERLSHSVVSFQGSPVPVVLPCCPISWCQHNKDDLVLVFIMNDSTLEVKATFQERSLHSKTK